MSFPFRIVMNEEKLVAGSPSWSDAEGADKRTKLVAPLLLNGRVLRGLELIGRASIEVRNADLSFQLIYLPTNNRRDAVQMARVDWRPKTPHGNDHPRTPAHLLGDITGTHHHSFELNWSETNGAPLKWLPIAEEISPDFQSFAELIDGVGQLFRISNIGTTLRSPWPEDLFSR